MSAYRGAEKLKKKMKRIKFESLNEAIECYGRDNLIPISCLRQQIFYTKHGVQPKFVWEMEGNPGKITFWYLKNETDWVYRKWKDHDSE